MNDERPIEKLLRRYAKKRRDDPGTPLELHPATRRLLQGEVARQFPKRAAAAEGEAAVLAQVWKSWRARLIWAMPVLIGLGVGVWVLVGTNEKSNDIIDLAKNPPAPAATAKVVENSIQAPASPAPKSPAPMPSFADQPTLAFTAGDSSGRDRKMSEAAAVSSESSPDANLDGGLLRRREGGVTTAKASSVIPQKETEMQLATPSMAVNKPPEVAQVAGSRSQLDATAAPPPEGRNAVGNETIQTPGLAFSTPGEGRPVEELGVHNGYALPVERNLAPASAPAKSAPDATARDDKLETRVVGEREQVQAYSQAFANRAPVSRYAKAAKAGLTSPVLARFEVEQTGDRWRVIDSDGSTYLGRMNLPAAGQTVTVALEKKAAEPLKLKNEDLLDTGRVAATPLPEQQGTQSFAYRVAGTNRTLNQQVIFTWNFVPLTDALAATQFKSPGGGGNVLQNNLPAQQRPSLLNNSAINGRAQLDNAKEIEINAVPVAP